MSRRAFGPWGLDLDDDAFGRALAALGVIAAGQGARRLARALAAPASVLTDQVREVIGDGDDPVPWDLGATPPEIGKTLAPDLAGTLASIWNEAIESGAGRVRLQVEPGAGRAAMAGDWLVDELTRALPKSEPWEERYSSVYLRLARPRDRLVAPRWTWPLRFAFLDEAASRDLRDELADDRPENRYIRRFAVLDEPGQPGGPAAILLVPAGLTPGVVELLAHPAEVGMVLLLGGLDEPWEIAHPLLAALQAKTRARAIGVVDVEDDVIIEWIQTFIRTLSHDEGIDVAIQGASEVHRSGAPLLYADQRYLDVARLSHFWRELYPRLYPNTRFPRDLTFDRESDGGTDVVTAVTEELPHAAPPEPEGPRFLQAQVFDLRDPQNPRKIEERPFRAGALHAVEVRIAPPDAEWLQADAPFLEDEPRREQKLTVVFTVEHHEPRVQIEELTLPPRGPSEPCRFYLKVAGEATRAEALITVWRENRVAQVARLAGGAVAGRRRGRRDEAITLRCIALSALGEDAEGRGAIDRVLLVDPSDGTLRVTPFTGPRKSYPIIAPQGFREIVEVIQAELDRISETPAHFAGLRDEGTEALLRHLARHGALLYDAIERQSDPDFNKAIRFQIVTLGLDDYFPAEFVYDRPAPRRDARLCDHAADALRTGECSGGCPDGDDRRSVICPLGFWSMTKILECHLCNVRGANGRREHFTFLADPSPGRNRCAEITGAIFAASSIVRPERVSDIEAALTELTGGNVARVKTWSEWNQRVSEVHPSLLVLLPHTEKDGAIAVMVVEDDERLDVTEIETIDLGGSDEIRPIALLLGCETAGTTVPFASLPAAFRERGAAITLATLTPIHEKHAAPLAVRLARSLVAAAKAPDATFGAVMRQLRREALADGLPAVLMLAAFGDYDWLIGAGEN